jgi:hypothetical protein
MANPQLSTALPEVGAARVFVETYDGNEFYPKSTPPGATPCFSLVYSGNSLQYSFLYVETPLGEVQALATGINPGGS